MRIPSGSLKGVGGEEGSEWTLFVSSVDDHIHYETTTWTHDGTLEIEA